MFQAVKKLVGLGGPDEAAVSWHRRNILTPDIWKLEQSMFQLVFIPDDMMRGRINNHLIAEGARDGDIPVHPACFTLEKFTFFKQDLGVQSFPIAMEKDWKPQNYHRVAPIPAKIKGQLYAIFSPRMKVLDIHRQNGVQFRRIRTFVTLPYQFVGYSKDRPLPKFSPEYIHTVEAWIYVGIPEYWNDRIGDIFGVTECNHYEHDIPKFWVDRYYKFE